MKYFGTDGIRGTALETLTLELAYKLGQAIVHQFGINKVLIGYDTRKSSPALAHALANGVLSQGADVLFAEEVSTPMVSYYSKTNELWAFMVTASHNPYTDNGIKVFNKGFKTVEQEEMLLEEMIDHDFLKVKAYGSFSFVDISQSYLKLYDNFSKTAYKVAFDAANGATFQIAPRVWNMLSQQHSGFFINPDGYNINKDCGSTHADVLYKIVKDQKYDLGFSYDGDGDRLIVCDQNRIYDGDVLIYAYAKYLKKKGLLKQNKVVLTVMSNPGIIKAFKALGIEVIQTPVGDKYVVEQIYQNDLSIGGENSGHIILNHLLHTGDGLFASAYLVHLLTEEKTTLSKYVEEVSLYPFILENLKNVDKTILKDESFNIELRKIQDSVINGLVLVRASGTENLIRITVSHQDQQLVEETIKQIKNLILKG